MERPFCIIKLFFVISVSLILSCGNVEGPDNFDNGADTSNTDTSSTKDTKLPIRISDALLTLNDSMLEVTLTWTAPHDDSLPEPVTAYLIRYSHSLYAISMWDLGIPVFDPPPAGIPGEEQSYSGFQYVQRGKNLYAAIKSIDEAGNVSEMSNIAFVHIPGYIFTGRCVDVYTGSPLEGLHAVLSAGNSYPFQTDSGGFFKKDDLAIGNIYIDISGGTAQQDYHRFLQKFYFLGDTILTIPMIPFEPTSSGDFPALLSLFKVLTRTNEADNSTTLYKWKKTPIECYIPSFVNDSGIDYQAAAIQAASRWMDASGWELFSFVQSPPDTGIEISYRTQQEMGSLRGITYHTNGADNLPLKDTIAIADYLTNNDFVYKVLLHELGHAIRLGHLNLSNYIMYIGQPLPDDISADEVSVVRLLEALPNKTAMGMYDDTPP